MYWYLLVLVFLICMQNILVLKLVLTFTFYICQKPMVLFFKKVTKPSFQGEKRHFG